MRKSGQLASEGAALLYGNAQSRKAIATPWKALREGAAFQAPNAAENYPYKRNKEKKVSGNRKDEGLAFWG